MKRIPLAVPILLAACVSQPIEAQLATACNSVAAGYLTAAGYRAQGKLSPAQIKTLTDLEPLAQSSCNKANPPTDLNAALTNANAWLTQWALLNAGVKK